MLQVSADDHVCHGGGEGTPRELDHLLCSFRGMSPSSVLVLSFRAVMQVRMTGQTLDIA